ncbi:MAG TPA: response regulator [Myxococcales bacterium]|jgi:CheY-like chemotaxis protein
MTGGSVMVVEDDGDIREVVGGLLDAAGFRVLSARNGREALEHLDRGPKPCVILLDLVMPEMNGWQFLEALRRRQGFEKVPVVVVTTYPSIVEGANALLQKPFDFENLVATVSRFCNGMR